MEVDLTLFSPSLVKRGHNSPKEVGSVDKKLAIELKYYSVIQR